MPSKESEKKVRVCLYARVSTQEQNLENQLLVLQKEVERHEDWIIVGTYTDKASGSNQNRPGLDAMMDELVRRKKVDLILCTKLDRFARSVLNLSKTCKELDELNVGLKFTEQNIDTTTPEGRMVRTMLGAIAEFELELIHSRTKDGQARARKEGKIIGRPKTALSDYQIQKAKEILAENPDISQRQFADQFNGIGRRQLIEELRKLGIWTK